jgi:hypothetical protein
MTIYEVNEHQVTEADFYKDDPEEPPNLLDGNPDLDGEITPMIAQEIVQRAHKKWHCANNYDVEIDDVPKDPEQCMSLISSSDEGCWVKGWLWMSRDELEIGGDDEQDGC